MLVYCPALLILIMLMDNYNSQFTADIPLHDMGSSDCINSYALYKLMLTAFTVSSCESIKTTIESVNRRQLPTSDLVVTITTTTTKSKRISFTLTLTITKSKTNTKTV